MNKETIPKIREKYPLITVLNAKGGVGKTAIASNAALSYGYGVMTNDRLSIIDQILDEGLYRILSHREPLPEIPAGWPVIFDFGGYPDARAEEAMRRSQYVLIPVLTYSENIQTNLNFIQEITDHKPQDRIIVIANQANVQQYSAIKKAVSRYFPEIKTFRLKKTAAFAWLVRHKKSLRKLSQTFKQHSRYFKEAADQFDKIFKYIEEQ